MFDFVLKACTLEKNKKLCCIGNANRINNMQKITFLVFGILCASIIAILFQSYYIVTPGWTALQIRMGNIVAARRDGGLYFKVPIIDKIAWMSNRIQKASIETSALSKDLQTISIGIDVNYRYIDEIDLYKATLGNPEETVLYPFCHETIKAVIAQYTAEGLITNRHQAKGMIYEDLRSRLRPYFIEFIEVNFSHADFSANFIKAVEDKQIAQQEAMTAKNMTERIREKAIQTKLEADAEAYAQEVKKQSITKELNESKAIEKWDGRLPQVVTGQIPFINLNNQ
jgi:regulator of protease activity HflC (stomatin/prohibitin superfamily)